ncbi:Calcineurin-like phosphoesterase [Giardia muris]|uniref:Calcineurin-like phosphoesterase n=1 Tax=Giardia muris TaxID=5742 RepID=A0A4Z1SZU2_GIAMU|nr:Calcineurin-like phosphoesterase [Giardia muris]|eukprot:TNJ28978.1 Calcineurin-like phosphoesterase [Giardia muris]
MRLLLCGDIHGNEQQLSALVEYTWGHQVDVLIYLGDLSPNRFMYDTPPRADQYVRSVVFPYLLAARARYKFVMPGNTDFHMNTNTYEKEFQDPRNGSFEFLRHGIRVIEDKVAIFLSCYTPLSPHVLKDAECVDIRSDLSFKGQSCPYLKSAEYTTRVIEQHSLCPTCGEDIFSRQGRPCLCSNKGFDSIASQKVTSPPRKGRHLTHSMTHRERILTRGIISTSMTKESDEFIMGGDTLAYMKAYFCDIDLRDTADHPEWFQRQQLTTLYEKAALSILGYYGLCGTSPYVETLTSTPSDFPESMDTKYVHPHDILSTPMKKRQQIPLNIWATHGPAYNTTSDRLLSGDHCGSKGFRYLLDILPSKCMPQVHVTGHIHETARDGTYSSEIAFEKEDGVTTTHFLALGSEGITIPHCKKFSFILLDVSDSTGDIISFERITLPVELYRDAEDASRLFRQSLAKILRRESLNSNE